MPASASLTILSRACALAIARPVSSPRRPSRASSRSPSAPGSRAPAHSAPQRRPPTRTGQATTERTAGIPPHATASAGSMTAWRSWTRALRPVRCTAATAVPPSSGAAEPIGTGGAPGTAHAPTSTPRSPSKRVTPAAAGPDQDPGLLGDAAEGLLGLRLAGDEHGDAPDRRLLLLDAPAARDVAREPGVAHDGAVGVDDRRDRAGHREARAAARHERPVARVLLLARVGEQRGEAADGPGGRGEGGELAGLVPQREVGRPHHVRRGEAEHELGALPPLDDHAVGVRDDHGEAPCGAHQPAQPVTRPQALDAHPGNGRRTESGTRVSLILLRRARKRGEPARQSSRDGRPSRSSSSDAVERPASDASRTSARGDASGAPRVR